MLWYIAIGSAIGGVIRYLVGGVVQRLTADTFPLGTLVVNIAAMYVALSVGLSLLATILGFAAARELVGIARL